MTATMQNEQLLKKLEDAAVCCRDCGLKYGIYSVGCSSSWVGTCRVCDEDKWVTETRDWGYLYKGRTELRKLMEEDGHTNLDIKVS